MTEKYVQKSKIIGWLTPSDLLLQINKINIDYSFTVTVKRTTPRQTDKLNYSIINYFEKK